MSHAVCILMISCTFMVVWPEMRLYFEGEADRIAKGHTAKGVEEPGFVARYV